MASQATWEHWMELMAAGHVAHTADSTEPGRKKSSRTRSQDKCLSSRPLILNGLPSLEILPLIRKQVLRVGAPGGPFRCINSVYQLSCTVIKYQEKINFQIQDLFGLEVL